MEEDQCIGGTIITMARAGEWGIITITTGTGAAGDVAACP